MNRTLKAARADTRVAVRRALGLWSSARRSRVALTDSHGCGNLGDDAVFEAGRRLLADCFVDSYFAVSKERRLERIGLSGARYFTQYVMGGGTMINDQGLGLVRLALHQGLPAWTLGTGAGSFGLTVSHAPDLSDWRALLPKFRAVGLRGPRSLALVRSLGVERVQVVGDLALGLTPDAPSQRAPDRCFAVNVMSRPMDGSERWIDDVNDLVAAVTHDAIGRGWRPIFVALCHEDHVALRSVMRGAQKSDLPLHTPRSAQQFFDLVGPCAFMISTRLHGSILSSCVGTQPVALAYRDKVYDFMESVEMADYAVSVSEPDKLRALVTELTRSHFDRRQLVWDRARAFRSTLERYVRTQLAENDPAK